MVRFDRVALIGCALVVAVAMWSAAAPSAHAVVMLYASIEDLTDASDRVVLGVVHREEVFAGDYGRTTTRWAIDVERTLKGEHVDVVRFTQWAGELDGETLKIAGDAHFEHGERVLVFLMGDDPNAMFLTAMALSKFSVTDVEVPLVPSDALLEPTPDALPVLVPTPVRAPALDDAVIGPPLSVPAVAPTTWIVTRDLGEVLFYGDDGDVYHADEGPMTLAMVEARVRAALDASEVRP